MAVSFNRYALSLPESEKSELVDSVDDSASACSNINNHSRDHYNTSTTINHTKSLTVPLCVLGEVQLRFLCPEDLEEVRELCEDWFPISELYQQ